MKLIITTDFPPMTGGIARWAFELYKELKAKKEEVKVIIRKNSSKNLLNDPDFIYYNSTKEIKNILNKFRKNIDILIFFHTDCALPVFLWCKFKRLKYIIVLHGKEFLRPRSFYTEFKKTLLLKFALEIWVLSDYMQNIALKRKVKKDKIKIKKVLIDRKIFRKFSKAKINKLKQLYKLTHKKIILTVARLTPKKDFFTVIKAVKIIKEQIPNILYIIVGDGELKSKLNNYIKKQKLEKYIKLLGEISDTKKLVELYNICDVFVLTSKEIKEASDVETFGIVYAEAAACGKPVIGADTGGVKFSLSLIDNSYLIQPGDYKKLAWLITKILFS